MSKILFRKPNYNGHKLYWDATGDTCVVYGTNKHGQPRSATAYRVEGMSPTKWELPGHSELLSHQNVGENLANHVVELINKDNNEMEGSLPSTEK